MAHLDLEDHGPGQVLARSDVGSVSMCSCGVLTLTLQYLSLRFEPGAFRELQGLLAHAQRRLDLSIGSETPAPTAQTRDDAPNVH